MFLFRSLCAAFLLALPILAQPTSTGTPPTVTGMFAVTFTADPAAAGRVAWIVEAKAGESWREVATATQPGEVKFSDTAIVGAKYTIRMRTRSLEAPSFVSEPSAESSVDIPAALAPPGSVQLRILVTVTVAPQ